MSLEKLAMIAALLMALSMAAERLVEIIKAITPFFDRAHADPRLEAYRRAALHALAALSGIATATMALPMLPADIASAASASPLAMVSLGLLASGGSGFWNAVLGYATNTKELKKLTAVQQRDALGLVPGAHRDLDIGIEQVTSNECFDVEEA